MKCLGAVALLVAVFALPTCAQRSFSRGGFSGHTAGFHSGFSSFPSYRFAAPARYTGSRYFHSAPMYRGGVPSSIAAGPGDIWNRLYRPRRHQALRYGTGMYYVAPGGTAWIGPDSLDYADTADYDNSAAAPDSSENEDNGEPELQPWPTLYSYNQPTYERSHPATTPENEEAVTLVFKDGRPSVQIYNYAMTTSTLYVLDTPRRTIPLNQLNLAATKKINDDADVSFQLPQASK